VDVEATGFPDYVPVAHRPSRSQSDPLVSGTSPDRFKYGYRVAPWSPPPCPVNLGPVAHRGTRDHHEGAIGDSVSGAARAGCGTELGVRQRRVSVLRAVDIEGDLRTSR
jgi:hypothetical protein